MLSAAERRGLIEAISPNCGRSTRRWAACALERCETEPVTGLLDGVSESWREDRTTTEAGNMNEGLALDRRLLSAAEGAQIGMTSSATRSVRGEQPRPRRSYRSSKMCCAYSKLSAATCRGFIEVIVWRSLSGSLPMLSGLISVFHCRLSVQRHAELIVLLDGIIHHDDDHIILMDVGLVSQVTPIIVSLGKTYSPLERGPTIV
jgi:hypothetical protein